jgi:hypothetical protein
MIIIKKSYKFIVIIILFALFIPTVIYAAGPPPPPPPPPPGPEPCATCIPIDQGAVLLIIVAIFLASYSFFKQQKKQIKSQKN